MSPSSPPSVPGYAVLAPVGEGATSTVWRGHRLADGMAVALKVVRPARGDVDAALREAGLLAAVRHRHVVHLYDVLPLPTDGPDRPGSVVLVTQLAAGGSLAQLLARRHILSPGELVTVLQPLAGALADLHVRGVVHGDLSTGNVLFRADGMPLLADLGTARVAGERGTVWGTGAAEGMVAPEVLEGFAATSESDVYQLGALAWLALAGGPPGPGHDRVPFAEAAPDLDAALVELVTRCMAPQPEDRPDAEELATVLMGVAVPEPVEVAPDADPAHGLTQRLRQLAQEDLAARPEEEPRRWWHLRRPGRRRDPASVARDADDIGEQGGEAPGRRVGAHRAERTGTGRTGDDGPPAHPTRDDRAAAHLSGDDRAAAARPSGDDRAGYPTGDTVRSSPWAVGGLFLVSAVVGAILFLALGGPVRDIWGGGTADAGQPTAETSAVMGRSGASDDAQQATEGPVGGRVPEEAPGTVAPGADAAQTAAAPVRPQIHADVQSVVDARAEAWEATDPALLAGAVAPDSPALAADTAELERAQAQSVHYPTVAFTVEEIEVLERDGERLLVSATVVRAPLEVWDADGWVLRTPEHTDEVELELVRRDDRWLLWSWTDEVR